MNNWNFRVMLNRAPSDEETDTLYEAGLDDSAVAGDPDGGVYLMCEREGESLLEAITSVLIQISSVDKLWAVGVGQGDAVTLGDAARRHGGRTQASFRQLASGQRGPGGFPEPLIEADNVSLYSWAEISEWLRTKMGDNVPETNRDVTLADAAVKLACRASVVHRAPQVRDLLEVACRPTLVEAKVEAKAKIEAKIEATAAQGESAPPKVPAA
ncbi:hypothetical protein AB0F17_48105 [Nonomuraea sp. NPDC026600]|uniref:hypothetical protein n=1 Tax=Nonomuraea sp. NPDC026600 TaxID=3155363 RepID=UPI0033E8B6E8